MSLGDRLFRLARANLNALLERAGSDARLDELSDDELEAELQRRRERRQRELQARETAERSARERAAQRDLERLKREAAARGASSSRAGGGASSSRTAGSASSSGRSSGQGAQGSRGQGGHAPRPSRPEDRVAKLYATLETPVGSDLNTLKRSFRRLMRIHHPDVHGGDPVRQRQANDRAAVISAAYSELEVILSRRR